MAAFEVQGFFRKGEPYVWLAGGAAALFLLFITGMLGLILAKGMGTFWPLDLHQISVEDGRVLVGQIVVKESKKQNPSLQLKVGNRDIVPADFVWIKESEITAKSIAESYWMVERLEYGNFFGQLVALGDQTTPVDGPNLLAAFSEGMERSRSQQQNILALGKKMGSLSRQIRENELMERKLSVKGSSEDLAVMGSSARQLEREELIKQFDQLQVELQQMEKEKETDFALFSAADGQVKRIPFLEIVRAIQPNQLNVLQKFSYYMVRVYELLFDEPRESNTEGGLFPAIFGTVILIFLMAIISFPFGVLAGIYLKEYAREGALVRIVRIGVNNLAGIPSIVYGIFGLGFFVYTVGSWVDAAFFAAKLPEPTFGTGGVLWASFTLGILTIPVVIVATEEALGSVPAAVRDNSIALGATKFQTLFKIVLPMASPGILTGFILAMARAAGEVAPLMITGVVKLAPDLPLDGIWPFLHLDRKFMHLGFHIYDISMQSPNVEAAKPMIYVTTFLLMTIVLAMTSVAIYLRGRMHKRYSMGSI
jgi:phosphate transport system permease protein